MGVISVAIDGAQAAAKRLQDLGAGLLEAERRAVAKAGRIMRNRSAALVSGEVLKVRTGALRSAINSGDPFRDQDGGFAVHVGVRRGAAEKYAPIHEFGGDIHRVSTLTKRSGPGRPFVAHYRARRYIGIAFDEIRPQVPKILADEVQQAVNRANG